MIVGNENTVETKIIDIVIDYRSFDVPVVFRKYFRDFATKSTAEYVIRRPIGGFAAKTYYKNRLCTKEEMERAFKVLKLKGIECYDKDDETFECDYTKFRNMRKLYKNIDSNVNMK